MRCEPAWKRSENDEELGMQQQTQHGLIACFGYRSWDSSSYAFPHPTASSLTRLCKCTLYMHNELPVLFRGISMLQTLNASCGKDQSKLFNNPVFSCRNILYATAFFGDRKKVTPRNGILFFFSPSPSPSIFSWDVVVPAKYFPSLLDVYVFPFFSAYPFNNNNTAR